MWNGVRCKENGMMELVSNLLSEVRGECSVASESDEKIHVWEARPLGTSGSAPSV